MAVAAANGTRRRPLSMLTIACQRRLTKELCLVEVQADCIYFTDWGSKFTPDFLVFATEPSFEYLESWFVLAPSGKIDLDRVRDRVKKIKIELKIKLNCVYGRRSSKYPCNISSSKALKWKVKTLGDPGLSKSLSNLAAFGRLCRSGYKVVTLLKYRPSIVYSD